MRHLFLFYYKFAETYLHLPRIKKFLIKNIYLNKPIIFDVGAYTGSTLKLFYRLYPNGLFYCFEPNLNSFRKLKEIKNKKIKIFKLALGNNNKTTRINTNPIDMTNTLAMLNKNSFYLTLKNLIIGNQKNKIKKENVNLVKLDSFCKKKNIKTIDILKIDTEGFELDVLFGAKKIIKSVKYLIIEIQKNDMYESYSSKKIKDYLKKNNFKKIKSFSFPFMFFEDCVYVNSKLIA